jgi:hypothetical protein
MNTPKKKLFFQRLAVAQLPILPMIHVDTLHHLLIHVGLQVRIIFHLNPASPKNQATTQAFYTQIL